MKDYIFIDGCVIEDGTLIKYRGSGGNVVIPEGVTEIGKDAFLVLLSRDYDMYERAEMDSSDFYKPIISSLTIPEGVTEIKPHSFQNSGVQQIHFPRSLTRIGDYAFDNCDLEEAEIPDQVTEIGCSAFTDCYHLKKVVLPTLIPVRTGQ